MPSFTDMCVKIEGEITRTDIRAFIERAVNDAITLWEGHRFGFNEKRYLINTVPAQEYYDVIGGVGDTLLKPDGSETAAGETVLEFDSITLTVSQMPYPLTARTQQWLDLHQSPASQYTGQPDSYGLYGNQIRLSPIPDAVYPLNISGLARLGPAPLTADDTNAWMSEGEILIREQAKVIVGRFPLRDDELIGGAQAAADVAYTSLSRKSSAKTVTGSIAPWSL